MGNQGDTDLNELRYQDMSYSNAGRIADVTGVLRNDLIIKTLRVARELEGFRRSILTKIRAMDKAA